MQNNNFKLSLAMPAIGLVSFIGTINFAFAVQDDSVNKKGNQIQIIGGTESTPYSRPYQVALLMNGRQGCGGTLISPQWVLTAAHCLDSASTSNLTVKVGAHSMSANDGTTHRVSQITQHEYWRGAQSIQSGYDIAVLRLASPVSSAITPASLPTVTKANQIASVGTYVTVSGWGRTSTWSQAGSDVLMEVNLPVMSNSACSSALRANIGSGVICGDGPSNTSACNGDSGGPYAIQSNGKFWSIGTVSWGRNCVGATAFTRTSAYLDWIEQKTGIKPDDGTSDELPSARFTANIDKLTVSLSNNSSDDNGIASSSWSFGDGSTSTVNSPSHTYAQAGSYTITLTVTDTAGQTNSTAKSVTVSTQDPCISSADVYPAWSATASYQIGDRVSHNGKNYEATWWSTGATPSVYTNVWKLIDDSDNNCPDENEAPVANFTVSTNGLSASFSNTSSDDKAVVSTLWNFGDGSTSNQTNPTHSYAADGTYTVSLTVTDEEGESDSLSQQISIEEGNVGDGCNGILAWSATTSYQVGDVVAYQGNKYEAIWWSTGAQPNVFSNVWTNKGTCN